MALFSRRSAYKVIALSEIASANRFALETMCRLQVEPVYVGDHTALCRVLGRFKFFVDTRDHGFGANLLLDGFWEMWLTMVMARSIKPGMTAVDIGANFGYYSLLMGDLVGPGGRLISVEPNPLAGGLLRRSLALNGMAGRSTIVAAAAADTSEGSAYLYVPTNEPKNACIVGDANHVDPSAGTLSEVPRWSLDAALGPEGQVDFIKIDAEGAEEAILAGMIQTLRRVKPILVLEYNALRYADPAEPLDLLMSIYGGLREIKFDGSVEPVSKATVLSRNKGEDWLLYFSPDPAVHRSKPRRPVGRSGQAS